MSKVNKKEFEATTEILMKDLSPINIRMNIAEAWLLIPFIQIAWKKANSYYTMMLLEHAGRQLQDAIGDRYPEASELIELGWHLEHGVDEDDNPIEAQS